MDLLTDNGSGIKFLKTSNREKELVAVIKEVILGLGICPPEDKSVESQLSEIFNPCRTTTINRLLVRGVGNKSWFFVCTKKSVFWYSKKNNPGRTNKLYISEKFFYFDGPAISQQSETLLVEAAKVLSNEFAERYPGVQKFLDKFGYLCISPNEILLLGLKVGIPEEKGNRYLLTPVGPVLWRKVKKNSPGKRVILTKIQQDWLKDNKLGKFLKLAGIKTKVDIWSPEIIPQLVLKSMTQKGQ